MPASRYRLERLLGSGGLGDVHLARDQELDRLVALKFIRADHLGKPEIRERFFREALATSRLQHPNLVRLYAAELEGPEAYLVLEYLEGETLRERVARRGPLDPEALGRLGRELGSGLEVLHRAGVLHRDITPRNVMLREPGGEAVLLDLGLVRGTGMEALTGTDVVLGTPRFWPPEILAGQAWSPAGDQYQLGAVLFEAATGRPLVEGDSARGLAMAIQRGEQGRFLDGDLPLDAASRRAIERATSLEPRLRFADVAAFVRALTGEVPEESALGETAEVTLEMEVPPPPGRPRSPERRPWGRVALAAALAASIGWLLSRPSGRVLPPAIASEYEPSRLPGLRFRVLRPCTVRWKSAGESLALQPGWRSIPAPPRGDEEPVLEWREGDRRFERSFPRPEIHRKLAAFASRSLEAWSAAAGRSPTRGPEPSAALPWEGEHKPPWRNLRPWVGELLEGELPLDEKRALFLACQAAARSAAATRLERSPKKALRFPERGGAALLLAPPPWLDGTEVTITGPVFSWPGKSPEGRGLVAVSVEVEDLGAESMVWLSPADAESPGLRLQLWSPSNEATGSHDGWLTLLLPRDLLPDAGTPYRAGIGGLRQGGRGAGLPRRLRLSWPGATGQ